MPQIAFDFPYTIYLFTNFLKPNEVLESCVLDGCSPFKMYSTVAVPMAKNVFLTLATMNGIFCCFVGMYGATDWGRTFTTITLTILPTFILYFFLSKYMLAGMTEGGAVKG